MSRFAVSKIENNQSIPTVEHMVYLLNQLDMTMDEFVYICHLRAPMKRQELLNRAQWLNGFGDSSEIEELVEECSHYVTQVSDVSIEHLLELLEVVLLVRKDGIVELSDEVQQRTNTIWKRLADCDTWYWSELKQLSTILYSFPLETVDVLTEKMLLSLVKYESYRPIKPQQFGLLSNLSTIYLYNGKRAICEALTLSALEIAQEMKRYDSLGFCQVRLGICRRNRELIDNGLSILRLTEEMDLLEQLEMEIETYKDI